VLIDRFYGPLCVPIPESQGVRVVWGTPPPPAEPRGGLAPWQLRRAQELLHEKLSTKVPLHSVAAACRLSVSHFARAFKVSTGVAPHRWLMLERVAKARSLLAGSPMSLAEIALACGFADQSHLSRVFLRTEGVSPGAWRRYTGFDGEVSSVTDAAADCHAPVAFAAHVTAVERGDAT